MSDISGLTILAGSEDPHKAKYVANLFDLVELSFDKEIGRDIAQHIVNLHNASLGEQDDICPKCQSTDIGLFDADNNQCRSCKAIISVCE